MNTNSKSLAHSHPQLAKEWHPSKNGDLSPTELVSGSGKKVWWQCQQNKDHIWCISPDHRTRRNSGCPFCSFKMVHPTNSLDTLYPDLANEWDINRNENKPNQVTARSTKKVYWLCEMGHSFIYSVRQRTVEGLGCPYCARRKASKEYNVFTEKPELEEEWHPTKNQDISPLELLPGTHKKVWWQCKKGHSWETIVADRTKGTGCPYCASKKLDRNLSLGAKYPEFINEWHSKKNKELTPFHIHPSSNKQVWWQCIKFEHHEWLAPPNARLRNNGCPYCSGRRVSPENSLLGRNPLLAKEWHPTKNDGKTPADYTAYSNKKVWWQCEFNHEWQATISNRNQGRGCPDCSTTGTSMEEQLLFNHVKRVFSDAENRVCPIQKNKFEADIYIPSLSLIIEYDGVVWHSKPEVVKRDIAKNNYYEEQGITLIRIREINLPKLKPDDILFDYRKGDRSYVLKKLKEFISKHYTQTLSKEIKQKLNYFDEINSVDLYFSKADFTKENSLLKHNPSLAREWHPSKNGDLKPEMISPFSMRRVWWQCLKHEHHEWEDTPNVRSRGNGCPFCSHRRVSKETSLHFLSPELANEWHSIKNGDLTPHDVTAYSNKKVWWQCKKEKDHIYRASINNRHKAGCPYCSGLKVSDKNRLRIQRPDLAKEWHPTKNGALTPDDFSVGSSKKVWWVCKDNHEWEATVYTRCSGKGCPYCSGLYVTSESRLAKTHPQLAEEWHATKNRGLTPDDVSFGSDKSVWWKASCGHEWKATVYNRAKTKGSNCPYCFGVGGAKKLDENNTLSALFPDLVNEWHPKNNSSPEKFSHGSGSLVWWKGKCGHEWEATISKRTNGRGCPFCSGRKVGKENSLKANNPKLASEWHTTKNGTLTSSDVTQGSGKKVWWSCSTCNYEWEAIINNRKKGQGCPKCAGKVK